MYSPPHTPQMGHFELGIRIKNVYIASTRTGT